jgi:hypothetical protein
MQSWGHQKQQRIEKYQNSPCWIFVKELLEVEKTQETTFLNLFIYLNQKRSITILSRAKILKSIFIRFH